MKRQGLQRITCPESCDTGPLYSTVANIETRTLPSCGACGSRLVPESLELASRILSREDLERHPAFEEFGARLHSFQTGQKSAGQASRPAIPGELVRDRSGGKQRPAREGERVSRRGIVLKPDELTVAAQLERERKEAARVRQLAGLVQFQIAAEQSAEIPF